MFKKIVDKLRRIVFFLEEAPITIRTCIFTLVTILAIRLFFEAIFENFKSIEFIEFVSSFIAGTILFFSFSYVLTVLFLFVVTKEEIRKIANVVLWGQWLAVLPPIIDRIIFGDRNVWSFYIFDSIAGLMERFITFFGDNPAFGITWGTRIEVLIAMIFLGFYIYIKRKKVYWFFLGVFLSYTLLFILGIFPSIITYFVELFSGNNPFRMVKADIVGLFLTPIRYFGFETGNIKTALSLKMALFYSIGFFGEFLLLQYLINKEKFFALLKNIRYPQMFFNWGLVFLGIGFAWNYFPGNFSITLFSSLAIINTLIAVFCAWYFSVLVNDLADIRIDKITNKTRPLITKILSENEFVEYSFLFGFLALIISLLVGPKVFLLILLYLLVTWIYSMYPLRLKRFVFISSILSSFASLLFLISGFVLVSKGQSLLMFPWEIVVFLFLVYAFLIPIKDLKDVEGDISDGVSTLPTILGVKNARMILGAILFLSYFGSVIVLNERNLFVPAILFGLVGYHIVTSEKYDVRSLPWWVLGLVFVYGILLVLITFL